MREGWQTVKLKDCCTKIGSGATPRGGKEAYLAQGHFSLIRSQNVLDFFFSYDGLAFIDETQASQLSNVEIQERDVLLNITGDSVARVCQVSRTLLPARVNQHVSIIRLDKSKLVPEFLKYFLLNPKFKNYMLGLASVGGTRNALTKGMIEAFEINLPSLPTQRRIATILSALDDKIELNRQTNQTLESIAQAIFKEWFVDFRFPHSPLEGWQAKPDGVDASPLEGCPKGGVDASPSCPTGGTDSLQAKPAPLPSWQKNSLFPFWALPKNHKLQERAKELRKQGILSEVVFWKTFKDKKKLGWDIDRQVIIGNFIVDFFIPELGLVFEIDGSSHNDKQEYDQERDAFLSSLQLKVVRISDKDVLRNIEGVWSFVTESIKDRVEELEEKSPPRPSGTPQEGNKYEMQDSELGPIPKGWRVGKLGDLLSFRNGKSSPERNNINGYPVYGANGVIGFASIYNSTDRTIIIGRVGSYCGAIYYTTQKAFVTENAIIAEAYNQNSSLFSFFLMERLNLNNYKVGSGQPLLNQTILEGIDVLLPYEDIVGKFENVLLPHFINIQNNEQQSTTLAAIRDALLPKLMNGEVGVALEEIV